MPDYENPFSDRKHFQEHREWMDEHLNKFFNESEITVFHEIPTLDLHLDIFLISPEDFDFNLLLTSGMSTLKMQVNEKAEHPKDLEFAELMMLIPKEIEFGQVYTGDKENDWMISILKGTAKFPHLYDTWLGIGHTIQAEADLTPYGEDTEYVGALVLPSVTFEADFTEIHKDGRKINIYSIFPLYKSELAFKIENGYNAFLDVLIDANGEEILDLNRVNLIT